VESQTIRFTNDRSQSVTLHALAWGDSSDPLVVLLHGGGANAHWWDHIAPALAPHCYVVALDFRGHGDSDHPEALQVGAFNADLESLLTHLGRADVVIVGHSMGAHVALDHAANHPATRGLVLIDLSRGGARRSRRVARLALALRRAYSSREEATERYRFIPAAEHVDEALRRHIAEHSVRESSDGRWSFNFDPRWFGVASRPKPDPSHVRCPTLLLRGAESTLLSDEGARALRDEIPKCRLIEIERAGHHVLLDQPDAVVSAIGEFLSAMQDGGA
jgi:pimeloyl-ACP methyl ester carboxylesterase